jgi:hypothetical protein
MGRVQTGKVRTSSLVMSPTACAQGKMRIQKVVDERFVACNLASRVREALQGRDINDFGFATPTYLCIILKSLW